jgi:hypothetical protein
MSESQYHNPFLRFRDIIPIERLNQIRVAMIGAGGIGAPAALALAKMGVSHLEIWDFDVVGEENLGPQIYGEKELKLPKVIALKRILARRAPWCDVSVHNEAYRGEPIEADIIITALDSLEARKTVWSGVDDEWRGLLVDPRMGAEALTVYSVTPFKDAEWYSETLEGEGMDAPCTAKSTFHCGLIAGALAAQAVKAWVVDEGEIVEANMDLRFLGLMTLDRETRIRISNEQREPTPKPTPKPTRRHGFYP